MGPVRHVLLIRLLACLVAIDLAVSFAIVDARAGTGSPAPSAAPTAPAGASAVPGGPDSVGILAGGHFAHRRRFPGASIGAPAAAGVSETAGGAAAAGGSRPTTAGSASTGSSPGSRPRSRSTGGAPGATGGGSASSGLGSAPTGVDPTASPGEATSSPGDAATASTPGPATPAAGSSGLIGGAPVGGTGGGQTTPTTGRVHPTGTPPAGSGPTSITLADKSGDTVGDGTGQPMAQGRADIVRTIADYTAKAIVLTAQVAQPVDPRQDPNWASDSTYLAFDLDTTGDGTPDFEVQYYLDSGAPMAEVSRAGDTTGASLCAAEAGYTADGYTVAIDPACLGGPTSFTYRATIYYDTDPQNANSDDATDVAPDAGLSPSVTRPAG